MTDTPRYSNASSKDENTRATLTLMGIAFTSVGAGIALGWGAGLFTFGAAVFYLARR